MRLTVVGATSSRPASWLTVSIRSSIDRTAWRVVGIREAALARPDGDDIAARDAPA
jgi:hypothetical protein